MPRALSSALGCCALLVVACSSNSPRFGPEARPPSHLGPVYYFGNGAEPESIDPSIVYDSAGGEISMNLFEGLTTLHAATLVPQPGLATSWTLSEDGRSYTFELREGIVWSDGVPITAEDFVWSWKRVLDPTTAAQYATQLWVLKNGKAYNSGKLKDFSQVGVRARGDRVLEVELEAPLPYFLELTSYVTLAPAPRHVVREHGDRWTRPANIVVSGAFTLERWTLQYEIALKKNPRYWDADNVALERAVALTSDDEYAIIRQYRGGILDYTGSNTRIPGEYLEHLRSREDFRTAPYLGSYFYWVNLDDPLLGKRELRQALSLAIDRQKIVDHVTRGNEGPADHFVPDAALTAITGYRSPKGPGYDPDAARAALARAGYPEGKGFPGFTLMYNTSEMHRQVAEAIQQMWKRELSIEVALENQEWKVHLQTQEAGDFQVSRAGWIGDYCEPYTFLSLLLSDSDQNDASWKSPEYDALVQAALRTVDPDERNRRYFQAEQLVLDELPIIPIYFYTKNWLEQPWVAGISPNIRDNHPLKYIRILEEKQR